MISTLRRLIVCYKEAMFIFLYATQGNLISFDERSLLYSQVVWLFSTSLSQIS